MNKWELLKEFEDLDSKATLEDWSPNAIMDRVINLTLKLDEFVDIERTKRVLKLNDKTYLRVVHSEDAGRINTVTDNPFEATSVEMIVGNIDSLGGEVVELKMSEKRKEP